MERTLSHLSPRIPPVASPWAPVCRGGNRAPGWLPFGPETQKASRESSSVSSSPQTPSPLTLHLPILLPCTPIQSLPPPQRKRQKRQDYQWRQRAGRASLGVAEMSVSHLCQPNVLFHYYHRHHYSITPSAEAGMRLLHTVRSLKTWGSNTSEVWGASSIALTGTF